MINFSANKKSFILAHLIFTGKTPTHNLMFQFLKSSWRSLLLEAKFLAWNSPNTVRRPSSARTRWGS